MYTSVLLLVLICQLFWLGVNGHSNLNFEEEVEKLTNNCLDGKNHKQLPGPEDSLHDVCSPWANRSCCTVLTSVSAHTEHMYNFDWNHCSHKNTLSDKCRRHFVEDLCFYECSPNVGPWLVSVAQKIRKQRFINVPLCRSDCEAWFRDCIDDYTCTDNWGINFRWENGRNQCPPGAACATFKSIYENNASYFCETVWDHSWKVVDDSEHCMRIWFNPEDANGNPNDAVARWKAEQVVRFQMRLVNSAFVPGSYMTTVIISIITGIATRAFIVFN